MKDWNRIFILTRIRFAKLLKKQNKDLLIFKELGVGSKWNVLNKSGLNY